MKIRSRMHLLLPSLALSAILATATSARAEYHDEHGSSGPSVSMQISFGTTPRWEAVPDTRVKMIRHGDRTDYDVFQYGGKYYAYNNHNDRWYVDNNPWYRFGRWSGHFTLISDRYVPGELRRIPRDHWRNYPMAWQDPYQQAPYQQGPGGTSALLQITFGSAPHWARATGMQVDYVSLADNSNDDVFRYDNTYYAYSNNRWYSSPRESGHYTAIDDRAVPAQVTNVPRENWRHYPAGMGNQQESPPANNNGQKHSKGQGSQGKGNDHN
jgi:hypothetical protein